MSSLNQELARRLREDIDDEHVLNAVVNPDIETWARQDGYLISMWHSEIQSADWNETCVGLDDIEPARHIETVYQGGARDFRGYPGRPIIIRYRP